MLIKLDEAGESDRKAYINQIFDKPRKMQNEKN